MKYNPTKYTVETDAGTVLAMVRGDRVDAAHVGKRLAAADDALAFVRDALNAHEAGLQWTEVGGAQLSRAFIERARAILINSGA